MQDATYPSPRVTSQASQNCPRVRPEVSRVAGAHMGAAAAAAAAGGGMGCWFFFNVRVGRRTDANTKGQSKARSDFFRGSHVEGEGDAPPQGTPWLPESWIDNIGRPRHEPLPFVAKRIFRSIAARNNESNRCCRDPPKSIFPIFLRTTQKYNTTTRGP